MNFSNQRKIYEISKAIETLCEIRKELNVEECLMIKEAAQEIQMMLGDWMIISIDQMLDDAIHYFAPHMQANNVLVKRKAFRFKVYAKPSITREIFSDIFQQLTYSTNIINIHLVTESKSPHIVSLVFEAVAKKFDPARLKKLCNENHWTLTFSNRLNIKNDKLISIRIRIIG